MNTSRARETEEELWFLLGDGHTLARSVLHAIAICWAIAATLALLSGNAWGQHRRHYRRDRHPVAQAQPAVAQPVQPAAQPSGCTGQDELTAREARGTGAQAFVTQDWETCATSYTISLTVANGSCARPEARLNLAICLDASGRPTQALEQLSIIRESGQLPPGTDPEALENRIATVRRHAEQAAQPQRVVPSALICTGVQRACSGVCIDLQTNGRNCGGCGIACPSGNVCAAGSCHAVLAQPPSTGPGSRMVAIAVMAAGSAAIATGATLLTVGGFNQSRASDDAPLLMTGEYRYPVGTTPAADLAIRQFIAGGVLTALGGVGLGVGIHLYRSGRQPPVRPLVGLGSIGFEAHF